MKLLVHLIALLSAGSCVLAAPDPPVLKLAGRPVELSLTAVSARALRITVAALDSDRIPQGVTEDPVLVRRDWPTPSLRLRSVVPAQTVRVGGMDVAVSFEPLGLRIARGKAGVFQEIKIDHRDGSVSFRIGDDHLFGLGEGGPQFDRRGLHGENDSNLNSGEFRLHGKAANPETFVDRLPVPLLIGSTGWAIFAHKPAGAFDLRSSEGHFRATDTESPLPLDLFVISAEQPADLLTEYARLTGFPSLPPLWALGYQQSHRTLVSEQRMLNIAQKFREDRLPIRNPYTNRHPGLPAQILTTVLTGRDPQR